MCVSLVGPSSEVKNKVPRTTSDRRTETCVVGPFSGGRPPDPVPKETRVVSSSVLHDDGRPSQPERLGPFPVCSLPPDSVSQEGLYPARERLESRRHSRTRRVSFQTSFTPPLSRRSLSDTSDDVHVVRNPGVLDQDRDRDSVTGRGPALGTFEVG